MGLLLKLQLSMQLRSQEINKILALLQIVIVLFLLRVMKDDILICLMTTLPQFMSMASVSTSTFDLFDMFRYTSQFCRLTDFLVQVH